MNEPKTDTIFHGNCNPDITHHSEGGYTLTTYEPSKSGVEDEGKPKKYFLTQAEMKALFQLCEAALAHQSVIGTHIREENDGRTED